MQGKGEALHSEAIEQIRVTSLRADTSKAERTLSPHDMNQQGLPLPTTPFNHRSVSRA